MSRLGVSSNLFGSLYDPERDRTQAVFNQNPTGRAGQAASFAAAQQSAIARQEQQRQEAIAAAQQQQAAVQAEATAAQQRREQAQAEAFREQEFKLQQAQFENNKAVEAQKLEESKRAAYAQEAARQNQERAARGTRQQQQYQRAVAGDNMSKSMQNHNARLKGLKSPFPELNTNWSNSMEDYFAQPFSTKDPRVSAAGTARDPRAGGASRTSSNYYSNLRANRASGMGARNSVRQATRSASRLPVSSGMFGNRLG